MNTPTRKYLYLSCAVATLGGLLFGFDVAVIAGVTEFFQKRFALTELQLGWAVASAILGAMLGAAASGWTSDRFGRKAVLMASAVLFTGSAIGTALPGTMGEFAIYRLLGGLGVGAASILTPLYIAELAPARLRGALVSFNQIMILAGVILAYVIDAMIARAGTPEWNVSHGWRWMVGSEAAPALVFFALLFVIPESPRWLVKRGREDEARQILERVNGESEARVVLDDIRATLAHETGGWGEVWLFRRALLVGVVLAFIQHGTGINVVMFYGPRIFASAGVATSTAIGNSIIIAVVMSVFTVLALFLVDRVGRRPLLLVSAAGMSVSLFLLGLAFKEHVTPTEGIGLLVYVLSFVSFYSIGMGPIIWVVISEIFPNRVRGRSASVAVFSMWSASLLISQFFPWQLSVMRGAVFSFYASLCVLALGFIWWKLPETKNRTLEEIEAMWLAEKSEGNAVARHEPA
jgi:sugar porter (SP) family MFS transporter